MNVTSVPKKQHSLPLTSCSFSFITLSLTGSRKLLRNKDSGEFELKNSLLDQYASRSIELQMSLLQFASEYSIFKGAIRKHTSQVIVRTIPNYPSNPTSENYGLYTASFNLQNTSLGMEICQLPGVEVNLQQIFVLQLIIHSYRHVVLKIVFQTSIVTYFWLSSTYQMKTLKLTINHNYQNNKMSGCCFANCTHTLMYHKILTITQIGVLQQEIYQLTSSENAQNGSNLSVNHVAMLPTHHGKGISLQLMSTLSIKSKHMHIKSSRTITNSLLLIEIRSYYTHDYIGDSRIW